MQKDLFYSLNSYLKENFGQKIIKLSLDGGFTCPNRDGLCGYRGCIFCSETGSGEFTGSRTKPIKNQIDEQIELLSSKWNNAKYIAYFQNFTNTYDKVERLKKLYDEALASDNVVGLAIATRPDCLGDDILELLAEYNQKTFLWVELGLQTTNENTAKFIRRGYNLQVYDEAIKKLNRLNIKTVVHLIVNFPNENDEDMINSIRYVCNSNIWGIKLQMLNIIKNTDLAIYYKNKPFYLKTADEYIAFIAKAISIIPKNVVIHRITGDADKEILIEPQWIKNKRYVLNGIQKYMRANNLYQGRYATDSLME